LLVYTRITHSRQCCCNLLCLSAHINDVANAHKRAYMIQRAFVLLNTDLVRAYLVYVRPLVEYNSVVSSPYSIQDIETTEQVQKTLHKKIFLDFINTPIATGYDV